LIAVNDEPGATEKMELAADWRAHSPVTLAVGPVLHPDDAVGNKMAALYGRAVARDFMDIDAVLASHRYTKDDLLRLAQEADGGFSLKMFAQALGALDQISDEAFRPYGPTDEEVSAMRERFAAWRDELIRS
jgi:hypothetical protein